METGAAPFTAPAALRGPVIGDIGHWVDRTPVHDASRHGQAGQLRQLIESGVCVNLVTVDSITPLHEACLQGHIQCVKLLLAAGAQVDARNIDGSTPLCDASAGGSLECMKVLLDHGAKVNPPLYTASPLHEACMSGANVNAAKLHETALHHAAKVKNKDLIEMLVEFGGNVYARDNRGKRPSDYSWPNSPTSKCFEYYEKTPRTLSQLCRLRLRKALGQGAVEKVYKLDIPQRLIDYLAYK
ncbi:ankyrin repeat and SOCS box protein 13 isoform X3 [Engystomops pustulosus]|uniref:ankyrin repeat and SOCS box protein 13 isoform X3 n=1 Tax=Engystomops pustulosus TaxID=76066 RepID=UPI003AFAC2A8